MLLQRLRDYARENLDSPPFHRERGFSWRLDLDRDGRLRSPQLAPLSQDNGKGKPVPVRHTVPNAVRTVGVAANLAADDVQYVLGWTDPTSKPDRVADCHAAFVDLTHRWATSAPGRCDPVAQAVAAFYTHDGPHQVTCEVPFTAKDGVLIVVEGQPAYQADSVVPFWSGEVARRKGSDRTGLCLVCGTTQPLLDTVPGKIPARLVPGASNDAALVSINERVFGYNLTTQLGASPLCQTCAEDITAGLTAVLDSRDATGYDSDSRLAWWLPHHGDDRVVRLLFDPTPEDVRDLISSVHNGTRRTRTKGEFCSLTVGGNVARVMVRDWVEMPLEKVEDNIGAWFADHEIASQWGHHRTHSIGQLVWATGRSVGADRYAPFGAKATHRPHDAYRALVRAAIGHTPLPPQLLSHLVHRVRTDSQLGDLRAALLRLCLVRSSSAPEKRPMPDLDHTNRDPAYVAGRLFAAYEDVQYAAYGKGLNTTYRDRYFAGALNNPRAALINGERDATAWLKKLRRDNKAAPYEQRIDELTRLLDAHHPIPARMAPRDQALFLVGYHHQRAHQIAAAIAGKAAKAARAAGTDSTADTTEDATS